MTIQWMGRFLKNYYILSLNLNMTRFKHCGFEMTEKKKMEVESLLGVWILGSFPVIKYQLPFSFLSPCPS